MQTKLFYYKGSFAVAVDRLCWQLKNYLTLSYKHGDPLGY